MEKSPGALRHPEKTPERPIDAEAVAVDGSSAPAFINASGHVQELDRNFSLWSICGLAITSGNTWIALGGSVVRPQSPYNLFMCRV